MNAKDILQLTNNIEIYNSRLFGIELSIQEEIKQLGGIEVKLNKKTIYISKNLAEQIEYRNSLKNFKILLNDYKEGNPESKLAKKYIELIEIIEKICQEKLDTLDFDKRAKQCEQIIEENIRMGVVPTIVSFKYGITNIKEPTCEQKFQINNIISYYYQFEELDK